MAVFAFPGDDEIQAVQIHPWAGAQPPTNMGASPAVVPGKRLAAGTHLLGQRSGHDDCCRYCGVAYLVVCVPEGRHFIRCWCGVAPERDVSGDASQQALQDFGRLSGKE